MQKCSLFMVWTFWKAFFCCVWGLQVNIENWTLQASFVTDLGWYICPTPVGWVCTRSLRPCSPSTHLPTVCFHFAFNSAYFLVADTLHMLDCLFFSGARSLMCPLRKSTTKPSGISSAGLLTWLQRTSSFDDSLCIRCKASVLEELHGREDSSFCFALVSVTGMPENTEKVQMRAASFCARVQRGIAWVLREGGQRERIQHAHIV